MQDSNRQGQRGGRPPRLEVVRGGLHPAPDAGVLPVAPPRVLAVAGAARGVGTSAITASLGLALAELGRRVLIVDRPDRLSRPHVSRPAARSDLVSRLVQEASRYDLFLVEIPAGRGFAARAVASRADLLMLVTTPDPGVALEARAGLVFFSGFHAGRPQVVVNRSSSEGTARDAYRRLLPASGVPRHGAPGFLGGIPEDPAVPQALSIQKPFVVHDPLAPSSCSVRALAWRLLSGILPDGEDRAMDPRTRPDGRFPDAARAA